MIKKILCMALNIPNFFKSLDLKTIIILVLAVFLAVSYLTKPTKVIDYHTEENNSLHKENKALKLSFDSLAKVNIGINIELKAIQDEIANKDEQMKEAQVQIDALKGRRTIVKTATLNLSANEVSDKLTQYLKNRPNE